MKEHLHLFTEVNIKHKGEILPCLSNHDNPHVYFRMSKVFHSGDVFHDNEGFIITHILDLSALTTKERANNAIVSSIEQVNVLSNPTIEQLEKIVDENYYNL